MKKIGLLMIFIFMIGFSSAANNNICTKNPKTNKIVCTIKTKAIIKKPAATKKLTTKTNIIKNITNNTGAIPKTPTNTKKTTNLISQLTSYKAPGGHEDSILVSMTLDSDKKITDLKIKYNSSNHESTEYMNSFDQGIKTAVVGKTIDQAKVGNINGASLTSQAFNNALNTIKA